MGDILESALAAIRSNKLRSILTIAIIVIGIMSLMGIQTAIKAIADEFAESSGKMGAEAIRIVPKEDAPPFTLAQAREFCRTFRDGRSSLGSNIMQFGVASHGGCNSDPTVSVVASDCNWLARNSGRIAEGRNFMPSEADGGAKVCLIGDGLAKELFKDKRPVGADISCGGHNFGIVGVLAHKEAALGANSDMCVIVPAAGIHHRHTAGHGQGERFRVRNLNHAENQENKHLR